MNIESDDSHLVGGISSAGRQIPPLDGEPFFAARTSGPYVWDQNDRRYIDTVMGFGATVLGHAPPKVIDAVAAALNDAPMPGYANLLEEEAAARLTQFTGNLSQATFANSGSEAVHRACQIARHITGKPRIVKLAAAYDGWFDGLSFGRPGTPEAETVGSSKTVQDYSLLRYNDEQDIDRLFAEFSDIAAIVIEPVLANAGCLLPRESFLQKLQQEARRNNALLVADEVLIGFRICNGLASHSLGLEPDLAVVGKAIGSGIAVAAVLGRADLMQEVAATGFLRAGTYNGNPVACAAVIATAKELTELDYAALLSNGNAVRRQIEEVGAQIGLPISTSGYGSVFTVWFAERAPQDYTEVLSLSNPALWSRIHLEMRRNSALVMPDPLGRVFISAAHSLDVLNEFAAAFAASVATAVDS
jgi:glutamate-1-semialdehyde 2,1-aminomutase